MKEELKTLKRVIAVVLGAGQGTRMGSPINKVFLPINRKAVIVHALETFEHSPQIDEVVLVGAKAEIERLASLAEQAHCDKVRHVIAGGATRHASEQYALELLRPTILSGEVDIILIHDGARPFISLKQIEQLVTKAREIGGAILAAPVQEEELIVQVDEANRIQKSLEEEQIWKAQTPQAFQSSQLLQAYDLALEEGFTGTDTASSLERIGCPIAIVESDATNVKITTTHDLLHAEKLSLKRNTI